MCFYTAHRRFDRSLGDEFTRFVDWTGFQQIDELVSADTVMCPNLVTELLEEDWRYNVHADNHVFWFRDYNYLAKRIDYDPRRHNILSIAEATSKPPVIPDGFHFCGYDILDSYDSISVLTDCGGFPGVFAPAVVNRYALLDDRKLADDIASKLRLTRPKCDHCRDCSVWSISRLAGSG